MDTTKKEGKKFIFLIGEDDYLNYVVLDKMLKKYFNCEVLYAANGKEVLNVLEQRKDIDLILLDIRMPIMDGFKTFEEVRKQNKEIPIVAVTAYAYSEDRKRALEMGFDEYIVKPFEFSELAIKLNNILSKMKKGERG